MRLLQPIGWALIAVMIAFGVGGTRDYLTYLDTVWELADDAHTLGIPETKIDGGASWDSYHLYTYGMASNSTYVVSSRAQDGYELYWTREYSSWLLGRDTPVYMLHRAE